MARRAAAARNNAGKSVDRAKPIAFGPLRGWIGFSLRLAQAASFQTFSRRSREIGEKPGRFATLMLIGCNPGISQTELSRANGRDKSTMTPTVEDLVRRGLVQRQRTRDDRRAYRLALTPAGEKTLARLTECARQHERHLERLIGARDRALFLRLLQRIAGEIGR